MRVIKKTKEKWDVKIKELANFIIQITLKTSFSPFLK